jgi:hypothetical protein
MPMKDADDSNLRRYRFRQKLRCFMSREEPKTWRKPDQNMAIVQTRSALLDVGNEYAVFFSIDDHF